jgi:plastocyanin
MKNGVLVTVIAIVLVLGIVGYVMFSGSFNKSGIYANNPTATNPNTATNSQNNPNPETVTTQTGNQPKTYDVAMQGFAFSQPTLTIKVGDTVTWTNMDSATHTVSSDSGSELSSGMLSGSSSGGAYSSATSGGTYSHTFTTAGTFSYHCAVHPNMKATVIVQ